MARLGRLLGTEGRRGEAVPDDHRAVFAAFAAGLAGVLGSEAGDGEGVALEAKGRGGVPARKGRAGARSAR